MCGTPHSDLRHFEAKKIPPPIFVEHSSDPPRATGAVALGRAMLKATPA